MSKRAVAACRALMLMVLVIAAGGSAKAAAPFDLTLTGPANFYPGQPLSAPFEGALTVAGVGVPNQTIELFVDNVRVASSATAVDGSYTISMPAFTGTADKTVRATAFRGTPLETSATHVVQVQRLSLTVTRSGSGTGTVTSSPAGINCGATCSALFPATSQVTLTASAASGSTFTGWSGGCTGTGSCVVTMNVATSVNATFSPATGTLVVTKTGNGSGAVNSTPAGISCGATCSASFAVGQPVQLTAMPASGSVFAGWSGGGCSGTGSCVVTMTSGGTTVTATFALQQFTLTVTKSGSGNGTVTSSPAGIFCGGDCTESYVSGTTVTLTASAAFPSSFLGWSGGCTGTGTCTVLMSSARLVTATFG